VIPKLVLGQESGTLFYLTWCQSDDTLLLVSQDKSRLRQQLLQLEAAYRRQLELLLGEPHGIIRGSLGSRGRKCGKPSCRCAKGQLHKSKYLTATEDGKVRQVHVPAADEVKVARGVERYRRFQKGRKELAALCKQQLELVDQLGRSLLEPYPPDHPLPPPKRRGRQRGESDAP
jgi:hypothetical protein